MAAGASANADRVSCARAILGCYCKLEDVRNGSNHMKKWMSPPEIVTRRSDGSMEKSRNDVPGHAFTSMFSWRMKMSCGERHVMSERAQVESDKLFWGGNSCSSWTLRISSKLDMSLPPIIQACTRPKRVRGEEEQSIK